MIIGQLRITRTNDFYFFNLCVDIFPAFCLKHVHAELLREPETDSTQCPAKSQQNSSKTSKERYSTSFGKAKIPGEPKQSCRIKELLEASQSLTLYSATELQY